MTLALAIPMIVVGPIRIVGQIGPKSINQLRGQAMINHGLSDRVESSVARAMKASVVAIR